MTNILLLTKTAAHTLDCDRHTCCDQQCSVEWSTSYNVCYNYHRSTYNDHTAMNQHTINAARLISQVTIIRWFYW